jgi:hypothetical protein
MSNSIFSQSYTNGYNYLQVNSTNFDNSLNGYSGISTDVETKHIYTLLNTSKKLFDNYLNPNTPVSNNSIPLNAYSYPATESSYFTSNGLRFYKARYCTYHLNPNSYDPNFRLIVIRPDDNIERPCVLVTNGATNSLNCRSYTFYPVIIDLALRGYVVAFYENVTSIDAYLKILFNSASYPIYAASCLGYFPWKQLFPLTNDQCTAKNYYWAFQNGVAAYNFMKRPDNLYKIDKNNIHTFGISQGAAESFLLSYARPNINFINNSNYYNFINTSPNISQYNINSFSRLSSYNKDSNNITIKSAALGSLAYPTDVGNFFQLPGMKNVPATIFHGALDNLIDINGKGICNSCDGTIQLKQNLTAQNVNNRIIVNCSGSHSLNTNADSVTTNSCDVKYDVFSTKIMGLRYYRVKYALQQYIDINNHIANRFYYSSIPYSHANNEFYIPLSSFNSNGTANGHLTSSSECDGITSTNPYRLVATEEKDINITKEIILHPNPANDILHFSMPNSEEDYQYSIVNSDGQLINFGTINKDITSTLNTDLLPAGIYYLIVHTNQSYLKKSFIITH